MSCDVSALLTDASDLVGRVPPGLFPALSVAALCNLTSNTEFTGIDLNAFNDPGTGTPILELNFDNDVELNGKCFVLGAWVGPVGTPNSEIAVSPDWFVVDSWTLTTGPQTVTVTIPNFPVGSGPQKVCFKKGIAATCAEAEAIMFQVRAVTTCFTYDEWPFDPDVDDWADVRVPANGGTVSATTKEAASVFLSTIKYHSLRASILRLNLFAGNQLAAAVVPLIIDAGTATDTVAPTCAPFGGDWTYVETGAGNGIGRAGVLIVGLNMGLDLSTDLLSVNDHHMACYVTAAPAAEAGAFIGASIGANTIFVLTGWIDGNAYYDAGNSTTARISTADVLRTGFYLGSRTSATAITLYRNGSVFVSTGAGAGGGLPVGSPFALCINANGAPNSNVSTVRKMGGYSVGFGMDATQQLNFYNAWQTFQTALSRQV